jgi:transcriptional regulator with XRE-family HTH domain
MTAPILATRFRVNMRAIRVSLGLSQSELARRSSKTPGYICDMERGRRAPNLSTLEEIASGLGVDPTVLLAAALSEPFLRKLLKSPIPKKR